VRNAAYTSLLDAERICREKGSFIPSLMNFDFDMDGAGEYLFQDTKINCYIRLRGASVFELDYLPKTWNYLDTFSPEAAAVTAARERRTAFADCLFPPSISLRDMLDSRFSGARYCGREPFELAELDRVHGKVRFRLPGQEAFPFGKVEMEKVYFLKKDILSVSYALTNRGEEEARFQFAPAIDLAFPGEGETFVRFFKIKSGAKDAPCLETMIQDAEGIKIQDLKNEVQIVLGSKKPFNACIVPVKTSGPAKQEPDLYQSTCLIPLQEVLLPPGETWATEFTLKFSH
jgi:hypothetical protein